MIKKYPYYFRNTVILFGLMLLTYLLFALHETLMPLAFALLLSILLNPVIIKLEKWKFPKVLAIATAIIVSIVVVSMINYLLIHEISSFSGELPLFKKKFAEMLQKGQHEISGYFGISNTQQTEYINEAEKALKPMLGSVAGGFLGVIGLIVLLPVYTFLILYYKTLLLNFLYKIFAKENEKELSVVLTQTKGAIQSYMIGLVLEALAVAVLNIGALLLLGVKYAVLLGVLGALINVLPFIGGIVAVLLPVLIATVTKDGYKTQVLVIVSYAIIQFVDNHFFVPYIVASKVKINALISIVIVLLGAQLWGIAGMFLSIPFIGVLKIIFDRLPELKPWGELLGDEVPTRNNPRVWKKQRNKLK